jgi:hypothetical protein
MTTAMEITIHTQNPIRNHLGTFGSLSCSDGI